MYAEGQNFKNAATLSGGAAMLGGVGAAYADKQRSAISIGAEVRQSEIEAQVHRLLNTAETLDNCVAHLLGKIEKVTAQDPKSDGGKVLSGGSPVASTILGRDLDSINSRIQKTISTLQSTIQRIEL